MQDGTLCDFFGEGVRVLQMRANITSYTIPIQMTVAMVLHIFSFLKLF